MISAPVVIPSETWHTPLYVDKLLAPIWSAAPQVTSHLVPREASRQVELHTVSGPVGYALQAAIYEASNAPLYEGK